MKNSLFIFFGVALLSSCNNSKQLIYKDPTIPVEERVENLLKRMTLEEKVGQLISYGSFDTTAWDKEGNFIGIKDTGVINRGLGSFWSVKSWKSPQWTVKCANGIQKYIIQKTRLGM